MAPASGVINEATPAKPFHKRIWRLTRSEMLED